MPRYLVPCACGNAVPADVAQAGGQVVCSCGATVDVPALRGLRELPVETATAADRAPRVWQASYGAIASLLIVAASAALIGAWMHFQEPKPPAFNSAAREQSLENDLKVATPSDVWHWWIENQ